MDTIGRSKLKLARFVLGIVLGLCSKLHGFLKDGRGEMRSEGGYEWEEGSDCYSMHLRRYACTDVSVSVSSFLRWMYECNVRM
ncbi:uncharacterized protein F4812DRAFT_161202 [Daldinia caldariorum]|uniref:uncharacterized protein n=1 Tax=Daldinia caldariorum TaxID=326644 RepID=UPI002007EE53|nr:uncharacterized protein F4812DRAFT_161202 [Daldinia caldariorum]KAI1464625.1 hypothetical protein F4812DRAFT_161202 [Daldinia caldariorum]